MKWKTIPRYKMFNGKKYRLTNISFSKKYHNMAYERLKKVWKYVRTYKYKQLNGKTEYACYVRD